MLPPAMRAGLLLVVVALSGNAWAQQQPDDEWGGFPGRPGAPSPTPPSADPPPPPPPLPTPDSGGPPPLHAPVITRRVRLPQTPNTISLSGAPTLGQWVRGESISVGFPLISLRFVLGLTEGFDLGVGFDSFYLMMNEPLLTLRGRLLQADGWALSARFEGGYAFFNTRASREVHGPRWLTGRRNINLAPGLVVSYQGRHPRAARFFLSLTYELSLDTEPYVTDPLSGIPPLVQVGHNGSLQAGADLPLSASTSFVFWLGLDIHGRNLDVPLLPMVSVGVVTSL